MTQAQTGASLRLIKKYPNRRLYDTRTSTYITLADVKQLVLANEEFQVVDAKSCLLYTSPSPRDRQKSRMPSSA